MVATWHTHGKKSDKDTYENFSIRDKISFHNLGVPGYLGTPSGKMRVYDPSKSPLPSSINPSMPGTNVIA